jgi:hypothetical protein
MVRALLDGRKTQTRRIVKLPPAAEHLGDWQVSTIGGAGVLDGRGNPVRVMPCVWSVQTGLVVAPRYAAGDRLYVREAFSFVFAGGGSVGRDGFWAYELEYRSDSATHTVSHAGDFEADPYSRMADRQIGDWRPSIHMPRWASRLTLLVDDVRIERLNDISEADAQAEGVEMVARRNYADGYAVLWNSLHGAGAWEANPFVIAVTFRVERGNIDQIAGNA